MKMRPLGCVLSLAALLTFGAPAPAQQDAPPVNLKQLKELLKQIKDRRAIDEKLSQTRLLQDFRTAASSNAAAISFYTQAIQATLFDGKAHEQSSFQDWRRDKADDLKSEAVQNAVRLHLTYLLLTIERSQGTPMQQLEPALQSYIKEVSAAIAKDDDIRARREKAKEMADRNPNMRGKRPGDDEPLFEDQKLMKEGLGNSIFVQWYGIQKMVSGMKDWESNPGNLDGIYQNSLLPYYRQNKDPKVLAIWDARIQRESQVASASNLAFKIDQFNKVRLPAMLWNRASDAVVIGMRNRGISEMFGLIKNNPDHPDQPGWISKLEEVIAADDAAAPAAPSPSASSTTTPAAPGAPAAR